MGDAVSVAQWRMPVSTQGRCMSFGLVTVDGKLA